MGIVEISMIGVGLAMDAFAVSVGKGLSLKKMDWKVAIVVGLYFGIFQAIMPYLGYISGRTVGDIITNYSGIIAFILLTFIGGNMIREACCKSEKEKASSSIDFFSMIVLAIATSIDAFAVGITFAFFEVKIINAVVLIGIITFAISTIGVKIGNLFGSKYEKSAQILGGVILIIIGIKAL